MNNKTQGTSKARRVVSLVILAALVLVLFLMIHKPKPLAEPMSAAAVKENVQSFQQKLNQLDPPRTSDEATAESSPAEVRFTEQEVQAALVQGSQEGAITIPADQAPTGEQLTLNTAPVIKFENDIVRGQFQTEVSGKTVFVTVSGHLGAKDGYATFDPTEFKIGDMTIPVSLVNSALQKKIAEQKDKLKLPEFIGDLAVQNGELVIRKK